MQRSSAPEVQNVNVSQNDTLRNHSPNRGTIYRIHTINTTHQNIKMQNRKPYLFEKLKLPEFSTENTNKPIHKLSLEHRTETVP